MERKSQGCDDCIMCNMRQNLLWADAMAEELREELKPSTDHRQEMLLARLMVTLGNIRVGYLELLERDAREVAVEKALRRKKNKSARSSKRKR